MLTLGRDARALAETGCVSPAVPVVRRGTARPAQMVHWLELRRAERFDSGLMPRAGRKFDNERYSEKTTLP